MRCSQPQHSSTPAVTELFAASDDFHKLQRHAEALFPGGHGKELAVAVEVVRAREVVGCEHALHGKVGAVRAAAHGPGLRLNTRFLERLIEAVDAAAVCVRHRVGNVRVGV